MDLNALKCIQIHIPQKGPKNVKKLLKKWQKMSENYKYGEKMKKIDKHVKQCNKNDKNGPKTDNIFCFDKFQHFFSRFHTMFGSRYTHFLSFLAKIRIFGSKFQPNQWY